MAARKIAAAALALAAATSVALGTAGPAAAKGSDPRSSGSCSAGGHWKLKVGDEGSRLEVEFEVPDTRTVALNDGEGFAIFLQEKAAAAAGGVALWFQVADTDATHATWSARGVAFAHGPQKNFWGYGAELHDPDGYIVRLWDERSMKEK